MAGREFIIVGISGGVDSAVAALSLKKAGFDVHGLHMTNWQDDDGYCTAAQDLQSARQVCRDLDIPLHQANFSAAYREQVFADFLREYQAGRTPNPDVLCNRFIKFGAFLDHARRLGASRIATGHYARLQGDGARLFMAADAAKDQTYFLHAVEPAALAQAVFPLGNLTKQAVRQLANSAGLANHDRPDSTGICFIGERPFREFLKQYLSGAAGPVVTPEGHVLGEHEGLMFYTLGQRSGIGIGGLAGSSDDPWYVAAKDADRNALVVVQGREHPLLWAGGLRSGIPHWINPAVAGRLERQTLRCRVRIRHRHEPADAMVSANADGTLELAFSTPQWAVTPGQFAVLYDRDECLGGAVIEAPVRYNHPLP